MVRVIEFDPRLSLAQAISTLRVRAAPPKGASLLQTFGDCVCTIFSARSGDSCTVSNCIFSFDYLVGTRKQRRRNVEPDGLSGFQIYSELKFYGCLDRQIGRSAALQDTVDIRSSLAKLIDGIAAIGEQPASIGPKPIGVHRREAIPVGQFKNRLLVLRGNCIGWHQQPAVGSFGQALDVARNVLTAPDGSRDEFDAGSRRRCFESLKISGPPGGVA